MPGVTTSDGPRLAEERVPERYEPVRARGVGAGGREAPRPAPAALDEAQRAAQRDALRFRQVFDLTPDPMFVTDLQGVLVEGNVAAADLVEVPPGGWAGVSLASFLHDDDVRPFEKVLAAIADAPCRVRLRFRGRTGRSMRGSVRGAYTARLHQVLWTVRLERGGASQRLAPSAAREGELALAARVRELEAELAARDRRIEAERRVREEAQSLAAMQRKVMRIVAHEAANVARCASSWAVPLARAAADGPLGPGLGAIAWSVHLDLTIVTDLLDPARFATHQLRSEFVAVDVAEVACRAVAALAPRADAARVELGGGVPGATVIRGEPSRLGQLLVGAIALSIDLAGPGGRVTLGAEATDDSVAVVVTRTGRDLVREELDWTLDPIDPEPGAPSNGGVGLALFVVRHLAELHGGRIAAEPASEDGRPALRIVLPRPPPHPASARSQAVTLG